MFSKLTTLAVLCAVGMAAALDDVAEWKQFKMVRLLQRASFPLFAV